MYIIKFTKAELEKLRLGLHQGAQKEISDNIKYSQEYISKVLNGNVPINTDNVSIIHEAIKIYNKNKEIKLMTKTTLSNL